MASAGLGKRFHQEHACVRSASFPLGLVLAFPAGILGARITLLAESSSADGLLSFFLVQLFYLRPPGALGS